MSLHLRNVACRCLANASKLQSCQLYTSTCRIGMADLAKDIFSASSSPQKSSLLHIRGQQSWNSTVAAAQDNTETFPEIKIVNKSDVEKLVAHKNGYIIDVRNPNEIAKSDRIGRAVNIPLSIFEPVFGLSSEDFGLLLSVEKPAKEDLVVLYCRSGVRAGHACRTLMQQGFTNVKRYAGSWKDWEDQE